MHMQTYASVLNQLSYIIHTVTAAKLILNASGLKGGSLLEVWDGRKEIYPEAAVLHITHPLFTSCVFYLHAHGKRWRIRGKGKPTASRPRHCHYVRTSLHFFSVPMFIFCILTGLNEESRFSLKNKTNKKKPLKVTFRTRWFSSSPPNMHPTSVVSLRKVQPDTELQGQPRTEKPKDRRRRWGRPEPWAALFSFYTNVSKQKSQILRPSLLFRDGILGG